MKWTENIFKSLVVTGILCAGLCCTKTIVPVYDQVANFYRSPDEIDAAIGSVYAGLRNLGPGFTAIYELNEVCTDEIIVPNRITNYQDDASWEQMWKQTWDPTHIFIETAWQNIFSAISNINSVMASIDSLRPAPADIHYMNAELRTIRAFYYYEAIDLFGDVPVYESNNVALSSLVRQPRSAVFAYIEKEILASLPDLKAEANPAYGYATPWLAFAILAKLYLNAQVYTGTPRWADCVSVCDSILLSNNFSLEGNFFDNFQIENQNSKETIFAIPFDVAGGLEFFGIQIATLHYNSYLSFGLEQGGSNGFCSVQAYLDNFSSNDYRRKMFLTGQQYIGETQYVDPVPDSANMVYTYFPPILPLNFNPVITSFIVQEPETEGAGARCAKWEFNKQTQGDMSNDYQLFRLADIILMKTEAQFNLGDYAGALNTINKPMNGVSIRSRANMPDFTMAELTADSILAERARELSWEGWRRNDMIRLGHFTDARIPEKIATPDFRKLFPIPQVEIQKNSNLKQNPGY